MAGVTRIPEIQAWGLAVFFDLQHQIWFSFAHLRVTSRKKLHPTRYDEIVVTVEYWDKRHLTGVKADISFFDRGDGRYARAWVWLTRERNPATAERFLISDGLRLPLAFHKEGKPFSVGQDTFDFALRKLEEESEEFAEVVDRDLRDLAR